MLKTLILKKLDFIEEQFDYSMAYARDVIDVAGAGTFKKFYDATQLGEVREGISKEALHVAKLVAILAADCGPCAQLTLQLAEADGVAPGLLSLVVSGRWGRLPSNIRLVAEFTDALMRRSDDLGRLREQVEREWGKRALVSIAYSAIASSMYPTLKYAMGYGKQCTSLTVGGEPIVRKPVPGAA